ncbi:unannotated protein [freshwater metagenome]|uniref:Unannotated protein n=1 Tax=freshwater metagenome TaxID=449393 RepID=A0A6J7JT36_9ZZZZ
MPGLSVGQLGQQGIGAPTGGGFRDGLLAALLAGFLDVKKRLYD